MKLNPEKDLEIDVTDLTSEFKKLSLLLFRYYEAKAEAEREFDRYKQTFEEIKARVYRDLKAGPEKHTEKSLEAAITSNEDVLSIQNMMLDAKRDLATWIGAVESMKAKQFMLGQLGADARRDLV